MHEPEVPDLIFGVYLLACQPAPPEPTPAAMVASPMVWRLGGRVVEASGSADAPPFEGGVAMLARCGDALPCAAELWRTETGEEATVLLRGQHLEWGTQKWSAQWKRLGTELSLCLEGGPLASPPAGDPGGFRLLSALAPPGEDQAARWLLHFSGANTCALSGELILSAQRDQVDSRALYSGGLQWESGGRANALEILKANAAQQILME